VSDDPVGLEEMLAKNKCVNKYFDEVALQVSNLQTNQEPWTLKHLSGASNPCLLLVLNTLTSDQFFNSPYRKPYIFHHVGFEN